MWFVMTGDTNSVHMQNTMWMNLIKHNGPTQEIFEKQRCVIPVVEQDNCVAPLNVACAKHCTLSRHSL